MTDNIYKTITFNKEVTSIVEKYMQDNNCTFNKAVNEIIKKHKKDAINIKMSNEIKTINSHLKDISSKLDKLL